MFSFTSLALKKKKKSPQYNDYNNSNVKLDVRYVYVTC